MLPLNTFWDFTDWVTDSFVYIRYEGEENVVNTFYCLAKHFYPPTINFTWTKNGVEVTEGCLTCITNTMMMGRSQNFNADFYSSRGNVYSCKVEHQASQQPLTRTWVRQKEW
uniref:Ig-like domain-containing protein n=1 Tax=Amphiprion percula TaxID=161767 RepID=A0A3P8TSP5_AMPPE